MNIATIRQKEQKGLGHAISIGASLVRDQSFIVSLPDMIITKGGHHMNEMIKLHHETGKGVIALMRVPKTETSQYGIVAEKFTKGDVYFIHAMVEKPRCDPPSNLAIVGRYILPNKNNVFVTKYKSGCK